MLRWVTRQTSFITALSAFHLHTYSTTTPYRRIILNSHVASLHHINKYYTHIRINNTMRQSGSFSSTEHMQDETSASYREILCDGSQRAKHTFNVVHYCYVLLARRCDVEHIRFYFIVITENVSIFNILPHVYGRGLQDGYGSVELFNSFTSISKPI